MSTDASGGPVSPTHPVRAPGVPGLLRAFETVSQPSAPAAVLIATAVVLGGLLALLLVGPDRVPSTSAGAPGIVATNLPPSGLLWFGSNFDPRTFAVMGRAGAVRTGSTVAAVAHLAAPITTGRACVNVELDGTPLAAHEIAVEGAAGQDVVGWTFALPVAGTYRITVTRQDGTVLATGVVDAR